MAKKIRVVLAEDHHVVRVAVATLLAREPDIEVIGEVSDAERLLSTVSMLKPDVLLLDAHMPGHRVIASAKALSKELPNLRILILSAYDRREYVIGLITAGCAGYVLKGDSPDMLLQAVRTVANGGEWVSPRVAKMLIEAVGKGGSNREAKLTPREQEVLRLMVLGYQNNDIADELVVTVQTVKNYVRSIFLKLGVETRVEAVLWAVERGYKRP